MEERTILLVEDNEHDIFFTQRALKKNKIGNKLVIAHDGEAALDYLFGRGEHKGRDLSEMPALTLLDLKMPKVDGLDVLRQMRANPLTRHLPVVILTSSREDTDVIKSYASGCNAYVTKPVDFDQFAEAVRELGLFWLILNQPPPLVNRRQSA